MAYSKNTEMDSRLPQTKNHKFISIETKKNCLFVCLHLTYTAWFSFVNLMSASCVFSQRNAWFVSKNLYMWLCTLYIHKNSNKNSKRNCASESHGKQTKSTEWHCKWKRKYIFTFEKIDEMFWFLSFTTGQMATRDWYETCNIHLIQLEAKKKHVNHGEK